MSGTEKEHLSLCPHGEKQQSNQPYFPSTQNKYTTTLDSPGEGRLLLQEKQPSILRSETIPHMFSFRGDIVNPIPKSPPHCLKAIQKLNSSYY